MTDKTKTKDIEGRPLPSLTASAQQWSRRRARDDARIRAQDQWWSERPLPRLHLSPPRH